MKYEIDFGFISDLEGGQSLEGYVPAANQSKSGVTIATGVDIGQLSSNEVKKLSISSELKNKLVPYVGKKGLQALEFLKSSPLRVSKEEADQLDRVVHLNLIKKLAAAYDQESQRGIRFHQLTSEAQTVIASVAFQLGTNLNSAAPNFWTQITTHDWKAVLANLRNFGGIYPTRRNKEADLLEKGMPLFIIDTKEKAGVISEYCIDGQGWISKGEGVQLCEAGLIVNACLVRPQKGKAYLRSFPDGELSNNFCE